MNENDIDIVKEEIVNNKDFEKSDTERETYENIEELKFPLKHGDGGIIILDDLNEKEMNDLRVQVMFKRSRHNNLSIFIISQNYYELPKRLSVLMKITITYLNQTISEMFKFSIKIKLPWM